MADELISRLDKTEGRALNYRTQNPENQKSKRTKGGKQHRIFRNCNTTRKSVTDIMRPSGEERNRRNT